MAFPDCKLIVQSMRWCDSPPARRVGHRPRVVSVTAHASCRSPPARRVGHRPRVVSGDSPPTRRVGRSDGSYLEDQDHWWLSGIHRDVWLYRKPLVPPRPSRHGHPCMQELTTAPAPIPHRCTSPTSTLALRSHQRPAACWALHSDSSHQSLSAARRLTRRTRRSLRRRSRPPLPALPAIALRYRFVAT